MKAFEILSTEANWCKGSYSKFGGIFDPDPKAFFCGCVGGAIIRKHCLTPYISGSMQEDFTRLAQHVVPQYFKPDRFRLAEAAECLIVWNDAPGRTFKEVRAALLACDI